MSDSNGLQLSEPAREDAATAGPIDDPELYALKVVLDGNPILCTDSRGRTLFAPCGHELIWTLSSSCTMAWIAEKVYQASNEQLALTPGQLKTVIMVLKGKALKVQAPRPQVVPDQEGKPDLTPLADLDPLLEAVFYLMRDKFHFEKSGEEALESLKEAARAIGLDVWDEFWPKSASILSRRLNEISADVESLRLGDHGSFKLKVLIGKKNGKRFIRFEKLQIPDGRDGNE